MRSQASKQRRTVVLSIAILAAILVTMAVMPLSRAAMPVASPGMALTIVNNTSHDIRHVYLSPSNQDNWGGDQLNNSSIVAGGTHTINNVACNSGDIKVIAEDENGCFYYQIVQCGETASWTIASDAVADCGNN